MENMYKLEDSLKSSRISYFIFWVQDFNLQKKFEILIFFSFYLENSDFAAASAINLESNWKTSNNYLQKSKNLIDYFKSRKMIYYF